MLSYKSTAVYLGATISDTGSLKLDVMKHIKAKRANVTIKFNNFIMKNHLSPISIKVKVLNTCARAALSYGYETWANHIEPGIEILYRTGLKSALSVGNSVNNEIVYVESGCVPMYIHIKKQQLEFWKGIQEVKHDIPDNPLGNLFDQSRILNIQYIKYWRDLEGKYD